MKNKPNNKQHTNKQKPENKVLSFIKKSETLTYLGTYTLNILNGLFMLVMIAVKEISSIVTEQKGQQLY